MVRRRRGSTQGADHRTRAARQAGYPARSVFKLAEIDRRVGLLRAGLRVLDLGAAPGSWSAYAAERIGPAGRLLAVDLLPLTVSLGPGCLVLQGDALELGAAGLGQFAPYDVVLSDMAPKTSGSKNTDQWRSFDLFTGALELGVAVLRPGGSFVGKLFMSGAFGEARERLRARFEQVRTIRPEGTRASSAEVFLVGLGARPAGED